MAIQELDLGNWGSKLNVIDWVPGEYTGWCFQNVSNMFFSFFPQPALALVHGGKDDLSLTFLSQDKWKRPSRVALVV